MAFQSRSKRRTHCRQKKKTQEKKLQKRVALRRKERRRKFIIVPVIEQKLDFVKRDKVIREHEVWFFSTHNKIWAPELQHVTLCWTGRYHRRSCLNFAYIHATLKNWITMHYFDGLQAIAEAFKFCSYPTVFKKQSRNCVEKTLSARLTVRIAMSHQQKRKPLLQIDFLSTIFKLPDVRASWRGSAWSGKRRQAQRRTDYNFRRKQGDFLQIWLLEAMLFLCLWCT